LLETGFDIPKIMEVSPDDGELGKGSKQPNMIIVKLD
jgi:hypothetical protein